MRGDLKSGLGLAAAVTDMDAIVHAATGARGSLTSRATDVGGTQRLLDAARVAGIKHFLYVSIVGMEGVRYPYYRTKLAAEAIIRQGGVPWTILRATQFHDLMELFLRGFSQVPGLTTIPFGWQFQPVDAKEVARRAVEAVLGDPAGQPEDFGGPEIRTFKTIAESWLTARRDNRRLMNLWLTFQFSRQFAAGRLLTPEHKDGTITFEQYLAEVYSLS